MDRVELSGRPSNIFDRSVSIFETRETGEQIRVNGKPEDNDNDKVELIVTLYPNNGYGREFVGEVLKALVRNKEECGGKFDLGRIRLAGTGYCCLAEEFFSLEELLKK